MLSIHTKTGYVQVHLHDNSGIPQEEIVQILGLIPMFIKEGDPLERDFKTVLEEQYGFGELYGIKHGKVDSNGVYSYPQDSCLHPLVTYETENELCYQYLHGIVAIVDKSGTNKTFVTRMD